MRAEYKSLHNVDTLQNWTYLTSLLQLKQSGGRATCWQQTLSCTRKHIPPQYSISPNCFVFSANADIGREKRVPFCFPSLKSCVTLKKIEIELPYFNLLFSRVMLVNTNSLSDFILFLLLTKWLTSNRKTLTLCYLVLVGYSFFPDQAVVRYQRKKILRFQPSGEQYLVQG